MINDSSETAISGSSLRSEILNYVKKEYNTSPEHLWHSYPNYEVLRHENEPAEVGHTEKSGKWYAILMDVRRSVLGLSGEEFIDIIDVKLDPAMVSILSGQKGYRPAYHMKKNGWLTILLDGSVSLDTILDLLDQSYQNTASVKNKRKKAQTGPKYWIIPANPKYYDVVGAFQANRIIDWKQSSAVSAGDIIYMYVAAPYSAILYKCKAVEVDIPYSHPHQLNIRKMMRIELLETYDPSYLTFDRLKTDHAVYAVRGPRSAPLSLQEELGDCGGK